MLQICILLWWLKHPNPLLVRPRRAPGYLIQASEISSNMDTHGQTTGIPTSSDSSTASCTQNHSPSLSGRDAHASGDEPLVILQINVKGWTDAKRELIHKMTREMKVTVVLIHETRQTMTDQLKLYGFTLVGHIPREHHGITTFARSSISFWLVGYSDAGESIQWIHT